MQVLAPPAGIPEYRTGWNEMCSAFPVPVDTVIESVDAGGVPSLLVTAADATTEKIVLWVHSGGYVFGSANSYRSFASAVSAASASQVLMIEYRLAPENVYPAAHDDVQSAYQYLLDQGREPKNIVLGGDSAGGGIVTGAFLRMRDRGIASPGGIVVVSPFADFTFTGESMEARAAVDPIGSRAMLEGLGGLYRNGESVGNPYLSSIYGDWKGAPPLLALVGTEEVLYDDAVRLVQKAAADGVDARLHLGEGQAHIWPIFSATLPEGEEAVALIGQFVKAVG
ncbi:MAG: Alpha/beta hydrolase [Subtercola sp.]|nr:Alpha/beta hydrolase [Subtercola sp.]